MISHAAVPERDHPLIGAGIVAVALVIAVVSARDHAGNWYDRSRLATVEALVDYRTLAIDQSIFTPDTSDKLWIDGHYYSDKSPVPALLMAGVYQVWQWCTGITARTRPDLFCLGMTFVSSGLAYVSAVWSVYLLGRPLRLPMPWRLALTACFALATVAPTYARHVNNHILLLGVAGPLFLAVAWVGARAEPQRPPARWLALLGLLTGLGYAIDLGAAPALLLGALATLGYRCRRLAPLAVFALGLLPFLALHHAVNYAVGGTFRPANAVPEYFLWPGCPFNPHNMTGAFNHTPGHFLEYAAALLFGKRGFFGHNLPLFLLLPALVLLLKRRPAELPELLFACGWCGGTWFTYAISSTNSSGACCSIRWFVPLLVPAFYVLAVFLREFPAFRVDFLVLGGWGLLLSAIMWAHGPWITHMVPCFWPIQSAALLTWYFCRRRRRPDHKLFMTLESQRKQAA